MKKLILAVVLAAGVAFPLASQAEVNAFGVSVPVEREAVSDGIRGGTIAEYPFYPISPQRLSSTQGEGRAPAMKGDAYTVQGIHLSSDEII